MTSRPVRILAVFLTLAALALDLAAKGDSSQKDILDYVNGYVKDVTPIEKEAMANFHEATKGISDFKTMSTQLHQGVALKLKVAIDKGKALTIGNSELQAIHNAHVKALEDYIKAADTLAAGLTQTNMDFIQKGKADADAADKELQTAHAQLIELGKQHGVEWTEAK